MLALSCGSCSGSPGYMILPFSSRNLPNLWSFDLFAISSFHCLYEFIPFFNCLFSFQWDVIEWENVMSFFWQVEMCTQKHVHENMNKGQVKKAWLVFWEY